MNELIQPGFSLKKIESSHNGISKRERKKPSKRFSDEKISSRKDFLLMDKYANGWKYRKSFTKNFLLKCD